MLCLLNMCVVTLTISIYGEIALCVFLLVIFFIETAALILINRNVFFIKILDLRFNIVKGGFVKIISNFFPHINIHGHILYIIHYGKLLNKNTLFIHGCTLYIFNYGKLLNENTDCISCINYLYMDAYYS